jgi:phenylacetate-CoA ligase
MTKPKGRSDDMLIIRGVNVFPSQVEHVILSLGMEPNYQIIVDRVNNLDTMTVCIEMSDEVFSDSMKKLETTERNIATAMQSTLGVAAKVKLVAPHSLPRTEGKAKRVIDNRSI